MTRSETPPAFDSLDRLCGLMFTTEETAAIQKCSPKRLEADRLKGRGLPYVKIGGLVRYLGEDIADDIRKHRVDPEQAA